MFLTSEPMLLPREGAFHSRLFSSLVWTPLLPYCFLAASLPLAQALGFEGKKASPVLRVCMYTCVLTSNTPVRSGK